MNRRTGEEERKQDFINLDESECFDVVLNDTLYKFVNFMFLFFRPHEYGRGVGGGGGCRAGFGVLVEVRQAANDVLFFLPHFVQFEPFGCDKGSVLSYQALELCIII